MKPSERQQREFSAALLEVLQHLHRDLQVLCNILSPSQEHEDGVGKPNPGDNKDLYPQPVHGLGNVTKFINALTSSSEAEQRDTKVFQRRYLAIQWLLFFATAGAFGAAAYYGWVAKQQWETMKDQVQKMSMAIEQSKTALQLNSRQTEATERSANAAKGALDTSTEAFHIDQRPYLVHEIVKWINLPGPNNFVRRDVDIRNIGKTTAMRIKMYGCLFFAPSNLPTHQLKRMTDEMFKRSREWSVRQMKKDRQDLAPLQPVYVTLNLAGDSCRIEGSERRMTQDEAAAFFKGKGTLRMIGGAVYDDPFGITHETQYCHDIHGVAGMGIGNCTEHNTIR